MPRPQSPSPPRVPRDSNLHLVTNDNYLHRFKSSSARSGTPEVSPPRHQSATHPAENPSSSSPYRGRDHADSRLGSGTRPTNLDGHGLRNRRPQTHGSSHRRARSRSPRPDTSRTISASEVAATAAAAAVAAAVWREGQRKAERQARAQLKYFYAQSRLASRSHCRTSYAPGVCQPSSLSWYEPSFQKVGLAFTLPYARGHLMVSAGISHFFPTQRTVQC